MNYKEINCKVALNKLRRKMPYEWDLNIYRGCEHGCKYCFAMYSHGYMEAGVKRYFDDVYVKINVLERLEAQIGSRRWKREVVNIGGVTDSYQPLEKQYRMMPEVLKLMIKYRTPCIISTKSDLVLRDYDLIDELSRLAYVNIAATVTCMDEGIREKMEPGGVTSQRRLDMLKQLGRTNASTGLHLMPVVPYLTDSYDNIDHLFAGAADSEVDYVLPGVLNLRGPTRKVFFDFVEKTYPDQLGKMLQLFQSDGARKEYKAELYMMINQLLQRYGLSSNYMRPMKEKMK